MSTNDLSVSLALPPPFSLAFLSFLCTRARARIHTPLVKKGSTRRCSSTHISTHSFIHSFVHSLLHSAYSFHTLAHTHNIYSRKKSIVLRRFAIATAAAAAAAVIAVAAVYIPSISIPFSSSFTAKATLYRPKIKVQNTVRESLLHTERDTFTR